MNHTVQHCGVTLIQHEALNKRAGGVVVQVFSLGTYKNLIILHRTYRSDWSSSNFATFSIKLIFVSKSRIVFKHPQSPGSVKREVS